MGSRVARVGDLLVTATAASENGKWRGSWAIQRFEDTLVEQASLAQLFHDERQAIDAALNSGTIRAFEIHGG